MSDFDFKSSTEEDLPIFPPEWTNEQVVRMMLRFEDSPWNFDNDNVQVFRAQAAMVNHAAMLPDPAQLCFPEYRTHDRFEGNAGVEGPLLLPVYIHANAERIGLHTGRTMTRINEATTCSEAISNIITWRTKKGMEDSQRPLEEFLLKVIGSEEYVPCNREVLLSYECVRTALRDDDTKLALHHCPHRADDIENASIELDRFRVDSRASYPEYLSDTDFLKHESGAVNSFGEGNLKPILPGSFKRAPSLKAPTGTAVDTASISFEDVEDNFLCHILEVTNIRNLPRFESSIVGVSVHVELMIGSSIFPRSVFFTPSLEPTNDIRFNPPIRKSMQIKINEIPRESILQFLVLGYRQENVESMKNPEPLAYLRMPIVDHRHRLCKGNYRLNCWEVPFWAPSKHGPKTDPYADLSFRFLTTTRPKNLVDSTQTVQLIIRLNEHLIDRFGDQDIVAPLFPEPCEIDEKTAGGAARTSDNFNRAQMRQLNDIIKRSPGEMMNTQEKWLIWASRGIIKNKPVALPTFLRSVDWKRPMFRAEGYKYLYMWKPMESPEEALELLGYEFGDNRVREYAVRCLAQLSDSNLKQYLLQLTQCLKFEPHHNSCLARFLIRRAVNSPHQIGHHLFWLLLSEMHQLEWCERFGVILEEYMLFSFNHAQRLWSQYAFCERLEKINLSCIRGKKELKWDADRQLAHLHTCLNALDQELTDTMTLPVNPKWRVVSIAVDRCSILGSARLPIKLYFVNADPMGELLETLYKTGDDLRQDILTLQVLSIMNTIWLNGGLNLRLRCYNVVATGNERGLIEIVTHSVTTNKIHVHYGGGPTTGARDPTTHLQYLKEYNKGSQLESAREKYARSCAGYCMACFVLGIGDRHPGNIMVHEQGDIFHIDFGHFLGNFKVKKMNLGITEVTWKRERSPFVFLPAMKHVINNGADVHTQIYDKFLSWCISGYQAIRYRHRLLTNLFRLMIPSQMPELVSETDINYMREQMRMDLNDAEVQTHVNQELDNSLGDSARIIDNIAHAVAHSKK